MREEQVTHVAIPPYHTCQPTAQRRGVFVYSYRARGELDGHGGIYDTSSMGRVYAEIRENGRTMWTLFDSGSKNTYITSKAATSIPQQPTTEPRRVGLGGRVRVTDRLCEIHAYIEGKSVDVQAFVTDELGTDESGRPIEVLFGALAMQQWHIRLIPDQERLDLTHYPEEFIEY